MKQAWVIGIVMLYVILMGLQMFVAGETSTSSTGVGSELHAYQLPGEVTAHTDPDSGASSVEIDAGTIASGIWHVGQMALLYFPGIFQGDYIWFWWCICFPIAVSFWIAMFVVFRGSSSV